jgi:inosine-uridine nucleoside N-ribohydrolase
LRATGPARMVAAGSLGFLAGRYKEVHDFDAPPVHDAVAVAAAVEPGIPQARLMPVEVEYDIDPTGGETVCGPHGVWGKAPNAEVGLAIDDGAFFDVLVGAFGGL